MGDPPKADLPGKAIAISLAVSAPFTLGVVVLILWLLK